MQQLVQCQVQFLFTAFLEVGDYNVVLMNWKDIAKQNYVTAASSVKYVARTLARLIKFLVRNKMNPNTTIVVGHSLGAHVAGIGSYLSEANIYYVVGKFCKKLIQFYLHYCKHLFCLFTLLTHFVYLLCVSTILLIFLHSVSFKFQFCLFCLHFFRFGSSRTSFRVQDLTI